MLISIKNKSKPKPVSNSSSIIGVCVICSNTKCNQSSDHTFVDFKELKNMAMNARQLHPEIQKLKNKITQFYHKTYQNLKQCLQESYLRTFQTVNRSYYSHINQLQTAEIKILCQVIQNDKRSLPSRKIWKIASSLKQILKQRETNQKLQFNFQGIFKEIQSKLNNFNNSDFKKFLKKYTLNMEQIYQKEETLTCQTLRCSKSSRFSEYSNPQEEIVEWKNLKIRSSVKNIVLNCKKLDDTQFLMNIPKLSNFSNIIQLEARQNLLTHLSCTSISNFLPQIITLDLRYNKIGDTGISKLKKMQNLRQLMVSQNELTDDCIPYFLQGFPKLEVLWVDQNKLTEKDILFLYQKQVLKVCSVVGNQINSNFFKQIKSIFARRGIIYL